MLALVISAVFVFMSVMHIHFNFMRPLFVACTFVQLKRVLVIQPLKRRNEQHVFKMSKKKKL